MRAAHLLDPHPQRTPASLRVSLLGGFELLIDGEPRWLPRGAQRLMAFLSLRDRPTPRTFVAGTFWPEATEAHACANLRTLLWRLGEMRSALIDGRASYLWLARDAVVDVRLLMAACAAALDRSEEIDVERTRWITRWGQELLPGWYEDWVVAERERIRQIRLHALESLCQRLSTAGEFGPAIEAGLAAVATEPLRESAHRVLIEADLAEGNRAEAVRHFRRLEEMLSAELGVAPHIQVEGMIVGSSRRNHPRDP